MKGRNLLRRSGESQLPGAWINLRNEAYDVVLALALSMQQVRDCLLPKTYIAGILLICPGRV